jgi:hypothetical protein
LRPRRSAIPAGAIGSRSTRRCDPRRVFSNMRVASRWRAPTVGGGAARKAAETCRQAARRASCFYRKQLRPGERASILCLAVDRAQARIVHRYVAGHFRSIPLLQPLVRREDDEVLELKNSVEIIIAANSYGAVRGRTIACAIFDEAAFWATRHSRTLISRFTTR